MKKTLSLIMALLMLTSLLAMPVYAGEDDGFNDADLSWCDHEDLVEPTCTEGGYCKLCGKEYEALGHTYADATCTDPKTCLACGATEGDALGHTYDDDSDATCNVCGDVRPDTPDEPAEGTIDNPVYVPMGSAAPQALNLAAGQSVYYQLKAAVFNGYTIIARIPSAITVDGVRHDTYSPANYGIKVVLELTPMSPAIVGFHNETEEDMEITLSWEMPVGTETDPYRMEDGDNAISIPVNYATYYASYVPTSVGEYTLSASDYENFIIYLDTDGDPETYSDWVQLTEDYVYDCAESYIPLFLIVQPTGLTPDITLTVTPPKKGTATNPYSLFGYEGVVAGLSGEGDGLWPISSEGVYYTLYGVDEADLEVTCDSPINLVINETVYYVDGHREIPLMLNEGEWAFTLRAIGDDDTYMQLNVLLPEGNYYNPKVLSKGKNTLPMAGVGVPYYATYTAEKDGVLVITPEDLLGLDYTDALNSTTYEYDYIFNGYLNDEGQIEGASEDFVLKVPVAAGETVNIFTGTVEYETEDGDYLSLDNVVLYVCYEDEHNVAAATCTKAAQCASCGLTGDSKLGHSYNKVLTKATTTANGSIKNVCTRCGYTASKVTTINKASKVSLSATSYTYNGKVQKPTVTVKDSAGNTISTSNYTVTYASGLKNAGTYKVTVTFKGNYTGTKTLTYKINPINVSKCTVSLSKTAYTYNGKVQKPTVTVKNANGTKLTTSSYTVTYASGLKNAGTYKVTVKMKGNYTGTKTLTYKINPINVSKCKITLSATSYTYNGSVKKPTVTVKNASGTKLTTSSYTVTYASGRKNVGTYKVTVKMKGNYTGTKTLTFKINPAKTTVSKLTAGSKKLTVAITKKTTQVTGYQIQYSTSKSFSSYKTKNLTSYKTTSATLTGLKAKTTYYVRVRTYKTVNGVKYYSGWSTVKYLKTK